VQNTGKRREENCKVFLQTQQFCIHYGEKRDSLLRRMDNRFSLQMMFNETSRSLDSKSQHTADLFPPIRGYGVACTKWAQNWTEHVHLGENKDITSSCEHVKRQSGRYFMSCLLVCKYPLTLYVGHIWCQFDNRWKIMCTDLSLAQDATNQNVCFINAYF
jgi:hypothetical protein